MANKMKKLAAMLVAVAMVLTLFPSSVFAADEHADEVHVIVENTTYAKTAGAPWEGRVVDTWVKINADSTGISVLKEAVGEANVTVTSSSYGSFISAIKGITSGDGGDTSIGYNPAGWMYLINDTMANFGIDGCTVAAGTLSAGDELSFEYSLTGGSDIGYDWQDTEKKALKDLTVSDGILSPAFSSSVTSYTLTVPAGVSSVVLSPEAENKTETVTVTAGGTTYKRAMSIPVVNGTKITITSSNGTDQTVYNVYMKQDQGYTADTMRKGVLSVLDQSLNDTTCAYGNEWAVLALARDGALSREKAAAYYASVEATVKELKSDKLDSTYATTNARVALAISAIGEDPQKVAGYNLLQPLANMDYINGQGVNAATYALLAFDAKQYEIPTAKAGETQTTREGLIRKILDAQLSDGGWDYSEVGADPDMTAMVLQALAPYCSSDTAVRTAVDKGLSALSAIQNPDGTYSSWGYVSSYSLAQVLTALSILKVDPLTDSRFIKNGRTVIDALGDFYVPGAGFKGNIDDTAVAAGANVQATYALVAYHRYVEGKNSLYDMRDAKKEEAPTTTETTTEATTEATTAATTATATTAVATTAATEATTASGAKDVKTPTTGDAAPVAVIVLLMAASMAGVVIIGKKKAQR